MSDVADEAGDLEIAQRHKSIQAAIAENQPQSHPDFDGENCLDCGGGIPEARIAMGKIKCVYCQTEDEKKRKYYK